MGPLLVRMGKEELRECVYSNWCEDRRCREESVTDYVCVGENHFPGQRREAWAPPQLLTEYTCLQGQSVHRHLPRLKLRQISLLMPGVAQGLGAVCGPHLLVWSIAIKTTLKTLNALSAGR